MHDKGMHRMSEGRALSAWSCVSQQFALPRIPIVHTLASKVVCLMVNCEDTPTVPWPHECATAGAHSTQSVLLLLSLCERVWVGGERPLGRHGEEFRSRHVKQTDTAPTCNQSDGHDTATSLTTRSLLAMSCKIRPHHAVGCQASECGAGSVCAPRLFSLRTC